MTHFVTTFAFDFSPPPSSRAPAPTLVPRKEASVSTFSIAVDPDGQIVATAFGPAACLAERAQLGSWVEDRARTGPARAQVEAYFAGELTQFALLLAPRGTVYQQRVWALLQSIPYGQTRSYGALAEQLASSPRAVGRANATNPICLIIPCHRVIGADGSLTGFAFGEEIKERLLNHESGRSGRAHATTEEPLLRHHFGDTIAHR